jgi:predicted ATPase
VHSSAATACSRFTVGKSSRNSRTGTSNTQASNFRLDPPARCGSRSVLSLAPRHRAAGQPAPQAPEEHRVGSTPNFYVITGASGAGKSTLVAALSELGYCTVQEAALAILREQQECKGSILPWVDRAQFFEAVLARNISNHQAAQMQRTPVFFDRGIPECLAWLQLSSLTIEARHRAAVARYRYAPTVFVAEPWPEIYVQNSERQASFERASRSYEPTVAAYAEAGYKICLLPKASVQARVAFILERVEARA